RHHGRKTGAHHGQGRDRQRDRRPRQRGGEFHHGISEPPVCRRDRSHGAAPGPRGLPPEPLEPSATRPTTRSPGRGPESGGRDRGGDPREAEKAEEVWHSVRLQNTGKVPWTTAPALTMQGGQVLGQDLIRYTSPGGKTTVKITQAVDIKAERAEFEVERKRNA